VLQGIDVSNHQGRVDWAAAARAGVKFAGIKASGGVRFVDRYYVENLHGCLDHGIVPIPYHFEHDSPYGNGVAEAEHFLDVIGTDLTGCFPPCLDLEVPLGGYEYEWAVAFLETVERVTGVIPSIYGSSGNLEPWLRNDKRFVRYPLWVAHYTSKSQPWVPGPWRDWTIWQYSSTGRVSGVSGNCDMNRFNGDEADLRSFVIGQEDEVTDEDVKKIAAEVVKQLRPVLVKNIDEGLRGLHSPRYKEVYKALREHLGLSS
jgi:lysozyme